MNCEWGALCESLSDNESESAEPGDFCEIVINFIDLNILKKISWEIN